jgi:hypothetical protein
MTVPKSRGTSLVRFLACVSLCLCFATEAVTSKEGESGLAEPGSDEIGFLQDRDSRTLSADSGAKEFLSGVFAPSCTPSTRFPNIDQLT